MFYAAAPYRALLDLGVCQNCCWALRGIARPVRRLHRRCGEGVGLLILCEWPDGSTPDPARPGGRNDCLKLAGGSLACRSRLNAKHP